jgi:hypothetical protein
MEPRNRSQGLNSASLCSLAVRYYNPIPTRFLAFIDFLKIPALAATVKISQFYILTLSFLKPRMYCIYVEKIVALHLFSSHCRFLVEETFID